MILQHIAPGGAAQRVVLPRRGFLKGLVGLIAAPAVVKAETLMPILVWRPTFWVERIYSEPGTLPYEYLVCRRDDLNGIDPKSLGLWNPHSFSPYDEWHWDHRHHPLVSLPRHKVRIQQQRVEAYTSQYRGWLDDDAGDKSWEEWVAAEA
jgi:hypothetical protein